MTQTILIVDDEPVQRRLLDAAVSRMGMTPLLAESGAQALDLLASGRPVAAVVLDLVMPQMDGLAVLAAIRERGIAVPVIVQTAQGGIETVVGAMRAGAFDFVVKPVAFDRLQAAINNALRIGAAVADPRRQKRKGSATVTFDDVICASERMRRVLAVAGKASRSSIPVLIEGESGVGKEVVSRAIQGSSERAGKPFVTVNCGALPENLVESILFGHEKGAFTGASDKHVGKFEEANGGTLFLDEVGELPLDIQVKLLRAIQEGEIDPVGSRKAVKVDIRLISATNRDLQQEVARGRFREDLYYRLSVLPLTVPPLRERREDVPLLAAHFVRRIAAEESRRDIAGISADACALLAAYDWPGNIRQLENAIFRAVVLSEGGMLTGSDFPQIAAQVEGFVLPEPADEPLATPDQTVSRHQVFIAPPMATALPGALQVVGEDGEMRRMEDIEADVIRFAIDHYEGRMTEVARRLGIGRSTLYRKLRELGLLSDEAEAGDIGASPAA